MSAPLRRISPITLDLILDGVMSDFLKRWSPAYVESVFHSVDALFSVQKQLAEGTLDWYGKSITWREARYEQTKKKVESLSAKLEAKLSVGQEKLKSNLYGVAERYLPESKTKIDEFHHILGKGVGIASVGFKKVIQQNEHGIEILFSYEKKGLERTKSLVENGLNLYQTQFIRWLGCSENIVGSQTTTEQSMDALESGSEGTSRTATVEQKPQVSRLEKKRRR